jgi:hypothetical protein
LDKGILRGGRNLNFNKHTSRTPLRALKFYN